MRKEELRRDDELLVQAEEAALDQGSVERVAGKRTPVRRDAGEMDREEIVAEEEEAALDQGSVGRSMGKRLRTP